MPKLFVLTLAGGLLAGLLVPQPGHAQVETEAAVLARQTALLTDFTGKIKAAGFVPRLPAPRILLDNPRSFGNYNDSLNVLHTTYWPTLPAPAQAFFNTTAQQLGGGETGLSFFEKGTHRWVFVHELGHWWRLCQHQKATPYQSELAANRLDIAYWRVRDPAFMAFMLRVFQHLLTTIPSPVPAGQDAEAYLNANYNKLPGGDAYTWYQARMIVDAYAETPAPTFKQAVARAGNAR